MAKEEEERKSKKRISKQSLQRARAILKYLKPYKGHFIIGLVLLFLSSITTLIVPRLMGQLAGIGLSDKDQEWVLNIGPLHLDMMDLNTIGVMLFAVFLLQGIISFFKIYVFSYVSEYMIRDLRSDLYTHMIRLPMAFFVEQRVGELNSRISADISSIQETFTTILAEFIRQIIVILLGVAFLFYTSPDLTMVMLITLPLMMIVAVFFGRFIRTLSKKTQDEVAVSNGQVQETLIGIVNVKSFTTEIYESMKYATSVETIRSIAMRSAIWRGLFGAFIIIFLFGSIAIVIWRGAVLMENGELDAALFFSFLLYTVMIGASFGGIASQYASIQKALGSIESVLDLIEEPAEEIPKNTADKKVSRLEGEIRFENVSFEYASRPEEKVISSLNIHVPIGQKVALVGPSGAGKSTIASLLLGFYSPTSGKITYDGRTKEEIGLFNLRANMAFVPQEVLLFSGTVRENIMYGSPDATEEKVLKAAQDAQVMEFIDRFETGLETVIGDRGIQLSGGQKQRLAIARALLKDPAILILDEATSSLDSSSEKSVQLALEKLMEGRTSVIIAHRLSTIRDADKIIVLDGGMKVEEGRHDNLSSIENGLYKRLSDLQFTD